LDIVKLRPLVIAIKLALSEHFSLLSDLTPVHISLVNQASIAYSQTLSVIGFANSPLPSKFSSAGKALVRVQIPTSYQVGPVELQCYDMVFLKKLRGFQ
jgi:hypothetical protein